MNFLITIQTGLAGNENIENVQIFNIIISSQLFVGWSLLRQFIHLAE